MGLFNSFVKNSTVGALLALVFVLGMVEPSGASQSGITYQGRILDPGGQPLSGTTQFKLQVRTPGNENCLLFEESQSTSIVDGVFSLTMNDGTGVRTDATGFSVDHIFTNGIDFTFNPATCDSGSTYHSNSADGRKLQVYFKGATMAGWEPMPAQMINFAPLAIESKQVQGFTAASLVRVQDAGGVMGNISPLSNANYTELLAIIGGTTTQYTKAGQLNGIAMPAMTSGQVVGWNGSAWTSTDPLSGVQAFAKVALPTCGAGEFLKDNGANGFVCVAGATGSGTVTEVDTGTGLTGGGFTTSGTISIANLGVDTAQLAANAVTTAKITDANVTLAKLSANSVDSSKIVDGSITGSDLDPAINITTSGAVVTGQATTRDFKLYPAAGVKKISFAAPGALAADYTLTWPLAVGGLNQVLTTDASGNLSWTTPAGTGITALTGDVTASGTGSVAATVASVGGSLASDVHSAELAANGAVSTNTNSKIVVRDGAGSFAANIATVNGLTLNNSGSSLNIINPVGGAWTMTLPATAGSSGQVLTTNGVGGLLSWVTPLSNTSAFVNGGNTFGATANLGTVDNFDLNINTHNTPKMTVLSGGNVGIGTTAPNRLLDVAGPMHLSAAALPGTPVTGDIAVDSGASNALKWYNGTAWQTVSTATGTGDFKADGTVPMTGNFNAGGNSVLGNTTASANLKLESTSNATKGYVLLQPNGGNVGIGTTSPATALDVGTGLISGGTNTASFRPKLDLSGNGGFAAVDVKFPATGYFRSAESSVKGTNDIFFQAVPASPSGYGFLESYNSAGMVVGTGGNTAPVIMQVNRVEKMRVDSTGNVGIGTTAPNRLLDVAGPMHLSAAALPGTPVTGDIAVDSGASNALKWYNGTAWQTVSTATGTGDFKADGTVPMTGNFNAGGNSVLGNTTASANLKLESTSNATKGYVLLQPNGGNVGIGTAAPLQKLSIEGTVSGAGGMNIFAKNLDSSGSTGLYLSNSSGSTGGFAIYGTGFSNPSFAGTAGPFSQIGMNYLSDSSITTGGTNKMNFTTGGYTNSPTLTITGGNPGNVGIGTTAPRAALDVAGTLTGKASVVNATSTVDFSTGNTQHTASNCGAFTLNNMKDGGSYMFIVKGTTAATCSFTIYSDSGVTVYPAANVHLPPGHGATIAGKHTLYNFLVSSGDVYISWVTGY